MRRLEGPELLAYDVLDPDLAKKVRILQVPVLPRGADGMTIGRWIFLKDDRDRSGDRQLLAHELVHVRQFAERATSDSASTTSVTTPPACSATADASGVSRHPGRGGSACGRGRLAARTTTPR